jgi:hypothetical protein
MSEYLCQDPLLVIGVNVVRRLVGFVGAVQQTAVSRVTEEQFGDSLASGPQGDVEGCIPSLQYMQ